MIVPQIDVEIFTHLHELPSAQQYQVLEFVRTLATQTHTMSGHKLLRFAGTIDNNDLIKMTQTIFDGCEQINNADW